MTNAMSLLRLASFGLMFTLASCVGTVTVVKTAKGVYPATSPSGIDILKTKPERKFEELATVDAMNFPPEGIAKMHNALRAKAAPIGANAVLITDEGLISGGWGTVRFASGVALRYQ
jgi:hypothetical protein